MLRRGESLTTTLWFQVLVEGVLLYGCVKRERDFYYYPWDIALLCLSLCSCVEEERGRESRLFVSMDWSFRHGFAVSFVVALLCLCLCSYWEEERERESWLRCTRCMVECTSISHAIDLFARDMTIDPLSSLAVIYLGGGASCMLCSLYHLW